MPTLKQQRTKILRTQFPNVLANIIEEFAGEQATKIQIRRAKKIIALECMENSAYLDDIIYDGYADFMSV
jgi:hypothetical protein